MVREGPAQRLPSDYEADKGRGGEIILRRPWQRYAFIGGLVGAVLLVIIVGIIGSWSAAQNSRWARAVLRCRTLIVSAGICMHQL